MDGTVLVADDDRTIRTVLTQALTRAGCKVHATSSLVTLMRWVEEGKGNLVISDVMMPDGNGLETVPEIARKRPDLPVIIISAQNTIATAIQAAEVEAFDYLPKPFDLPDLMKRAGKALSLPRRIRGAEDSAQVETQKDDLPLVGRTAAMQALYRLVARVMNADLPVMIIGESGTGKSLVARAIHDFSDRRTLPYVVANTSDMATIEGPAAILSKVKNGTLVFDQVATTIFPPWPLSSPILAAGLPLILTLPEPVFTLSGGPIHTIMSPLRAAGMPPINTLPEPATIGPPTCGTLAVTLGHTCI